MKKKFKLIDLDCANCAAQMEDAIKKIDGVEDASVSFMTVRSRSTVSRSRTKSGSVHRRVKSFFRIPVWENVMVPSAIFLS